MDETKPVEDWTTDFNIFDPQYSRDPAPFWSEIRQTCPIAHTGRNGGLYMTTSYNDAQRLVRETDILSNRQISIAPMQADKDLLADYHTEVNPPITMDPPESIAVRRLILPFFSVKAVEKHRPYTEALCHQLIDGFIDQGECDAAEDYAQQITPRVIAHMLGIDETRNEEFVSWVRGLIEDGFSDFDARRDNLKAMTTFFQDMIEERRRYPTGDYISDLITKDIDGAPLTDKIIVNLCVLLLIAGIDTTWSSIGSSLFHMATHDHDRKRLASEPGLFPSAIEELLRFYAPVSPGRIAMKDLEYNGITIKKGERMMMNFPAANRDPAQFENPDEVILDREQNRHVAFGIGHHRCAGSNLARMEMDAALRIWFERIPDFTLTDPGAVTWSTGQVRGARRVPVKF